MDHIQPFQDRRGCVRADAARSHLRIRGEQLGALAVRGWTNRAGPAAIKTWGKPMENHGQFHGDQTFLGIQRFLNGILWEG